jgi:hypothetical protein
MENNIPQIKIKNNSAYIFVGTQILLSLLILLNLYLSLGDTCNLFGGSTSRCVRGYFLIEGLAVVTLISIIYIIARFKKLKGAWLSLLLTLIVIPGLLGLGIWMIGASFQNSEILQEESVCLQEVNKFRSASLDQSKLRQYDQCVERSTNKDTSCLECLGLMPE